jgi:hypothetical protein
MVHMTFCTRPQQVLKPNFTLFCVTHTIHHQLLLIVMQSLDSI